MTRRSDNSWADKIGGPEDTPLHDAFCMFVHRNAVEIAKAMLPWPKSGNWPVWHELLMKKVVRHGSEYGLLKPPFGIPPESEMDRLLMEDARVEWEKPIFSNGSTPCGFIDIVITTDRPRLKCELSGRSGAARGWYEEVSEVSIGVEVKTRIESLGSLIRQVRMYDRYSDCAQIIVATPDLRFSATLQGQGILVLLLPALKIPE